jgi:hypothetical protein
MVKPLRGFETYAAFRISTIMQSLRDISKNSALSAIAMCDNSKCTRLNPQLAESAFHDFRFP